MDSNHGGDLAPIFGDLSQREKLSEINSPLGTTYPHKKIPKYFNKSHLTSVSKKSGQTTIVIQYYTVCPGFIETNVRTPYSLHRRVNQWKILTETIS